MFSELEEKTISKVYPTVNNDDLLEFRLSPNKGNMQLSDVVLRFVVKIKQPDSEAIIPENFLGPKMFSSLEIRVNGDAITRRSCSNEFFLSSYFSALTNFSSDYFCTGCSPLGIFDTVQTSTTSIASSSALKSHILSSRNGISNDFVYEIVMPIDTSIFRSNDNLPTSTPIDLSFERATAKFSTIFTADNIDPTTLSQTIELEDVYLLVPYVDDSKMQDREKEAISRPIVLKYDDYVINRFNIPKDSPQCRLANIINGPLPSKLFWGIMSLQSYTGSYDHSSTHFKLFDISKTSLYVDGKVCSGFPISTRKNMISIPYTTFLNKTNRYLNAFSGQIISLTDYRDSHFIQSASFDENGIGSITFDLEFEQSVTSDLVLITCSVFEKSVEIDHYRNCKVF